MLSFMYAKRGIGQLRPYTLLGRPRVYVERVECSWHSLCSSIVASEPLVTDASHEEQPQWFSGYNNSPSYYYSEPNGVYNLCSK